MINPDHYGLANQSYERLKNVLSNFPGVERILVYGSRAMKTQREGSDIDITVIAPNLTRRDLLKLENEIEELGLPYKIDLSLFHMIENPSLIDHILRWGKEL